MCKGVCMSLLTGSGCRNKVLNTLRKKFKSLKATETYYYPLRLNALYKFAKALGNMRGDQNDSLLPAN